MSMSMTLKNLTLHSHFTRVRVANLNPNVRRETRLGFASLVTSLLKMSQQQPRGGAQAQAAQAAAGQGAGGAQGQISALEKQQAAMEKKSSIEKNRIIQQLFAEKKA